MRKIIEEQLEKSLPKFLKTGNKIPWQERGILVSEAFAFCGVGDLFDIDIVLESGIWLGRSTEIFAIYFVPKQVIAIDVTLKKATVERLEKYDNLTLIQGDGPSHIKSILEDPKIQRAGIFIDGPKEERAIRLAEESLAISKVLFVALHDTHKSKIKRRLQALGYPLFFTDEEWFLNKYKHLDEKESQWDEEQGLKWIPRHIISRDGKPIRALESYGMTIGFIFNQGKP